MTAVQPDIEALEAEQDDLKALCELLDIEAAHASQGSDRDDTWLGPWMTRKIIELRARAEAAKESYDATQRDIQREHAYLVKHYGRRFRDQLEKDLDAKGKRTKTINYATGSAGLRKQRDRVEIVDQDQAVAWAEMFAPDCVKRSITGRTELKKRIEAGEDVLGVELVYGTHAVHVGGKIVDMGDGDMPHPPTGDDDDGD